MSGSLKLPAAADALLADFPIPEPDFEAQAKAIEARLSERAPLGDLLSAPDLPPEAGEPGAPSSARGATAPKGTFAEMARRSLHKKDEEAAQLAKELLAATAQNRRPNQELVARVRAAGRPTATPLPLESTEEPARPSGVVSRAAAPVAAASATPARQRMHPGTMIGIASTLVAIAACVALFLKSEPAESPRGSTTTPPPLAAAQKVDEPRRDAPAALPASSSKPSEVVSPEQLPRSERQASKAEASKPSAGATPSPLSGSKASAAPAPVARQDQVELEEDPSPAKSGVPGGNAEPEAPLRPAAGGSDTVPLTPSAGAVSTALSAVRGGAQACLAGQSAPVSATITFAPDGHVVRVSAPGPASACIQSALSKARIAPFARDTFSASTVVRPP